MGGRKVKKKAARPGRRKRASAPSAEWVQLSEAFPDRISRNQATIYALPDTMIDAIDREMPGFLSEEDLHFEKELTRLNGNGFFLKKPFGLTPLAAMARGSVEEPDDLLHDADEMEQKWRESDQRIRMMLADEMERSEAAMEAYFRSGSDFERQLQGRRLGYAGWLVTDPGFRRERDEFCGRWRRRIQRRGHLPIVPFSLMGEPPPRVSRRDRHFYSDYMQFYLRWGLESLATWELPVPMRADYLGYSFYHLPSVCDAGVTVFAPHYLLRDRSLNLYDVAEHKQSIGSTKHLDGWFRVDSRNLGFERYASMFRIYRFLELSLKQRYGSRLYRRIGQFDRAVALYNHGLKTDALVVESTAETVKKVRQQMQERLRRYAVDAGDA